MAYNNFEHKFQVLDLPNIMAVSINGTPPVGTEIHPFLRPLILKLAKARPNWEFYFNTVGHPASNTVANRFEVYEGNEQLGVVFKGYNYSKSTDVFSYNNPRMAGKRKRGSYTQTKNVNKAFKDILREFNGKTPVELLAEAERSAGSKLYAYLNLKATTERNHTQTVQKAALDFVEANLEAFCQAAGSSLSEDTVNNYFASKDELKTAQLMYNTRSAGSHYTVVLRGSEYIVGNNSETRILTHEQLSPYLRRCIGMLKLAEPNSVIPNVGSKAENHQMIIMPEPTELS